MKRFYSAVTLGQSQDGFTALLDGRPVRTPARNVLCAPSQPLAEAIADEWREQGEQIETHSMPLNRLATTAVDLMPARRGDAVTEAAEYAATDLLCYRAVGPASLVQRQVDAWQPWLDWAELQYDAKLVAVSGVMPATQSKTALRALRAAVERLDSWRLVGLHAATTLTGSLVLGLAIERGALAAEAAFAAAMLDEQFEIEQWGEDAQQAERLARRRSDLLAAGRFLALLQAKADETGTR